MKQCKRKNSQYLSILTFMIAIVIPITATAQKKKRNFLEKVLDGVEKTSEVIDGVLGEPTTNNTTTTTKSQTPVQRVTGMKIVSPDPNLQIGFVSCQVHGTTALIELVYTSLAQDAEFRYNGDRRTDAYDDLGNQYSAGDGYFRFSFGNQSFSIRDSYTKLPQDVPVKCKIQIMGIAENANVFRRINLYGSSSVFGTYPLITLHNIPIERPVVEVVEVVETQTIPATAQQLTASGKTDNEDFEAFMDKFIGDPQFQMSRIIFPLEGADSEDNEWTKENWRIMKIKASSYKNNTEPNQYKYDKKMAGNICREKIYLEDTSNWFEYTYIRKEGKWYLKKAVESM